jgi:hypothetical protein
MDELERILLDIQEEKMFMSYKMLLIMKMALVAGDSGRVSLTRLAEEFREFFVERSLQGKAEENPNVVSHGALSSRSLKDWERTIREEPAARTSSQLVVVEGDTVRWAERIRLILNPETKKQIYRAAAQRLSTYFGEKVPGGL